MHFRYYAINCPWKGALPFTFSLPLDVLCHVWLKLVGNTGEEYFQMLLIEEYKDLPVSKRDSP